MSTTADKEDSINQESSPSTDVRDNQKKIIMVRTADSEVFELKIEVAMEIETIRTFFLEDKCVSYDKVVPLLNVESWELVKIIEYCTKYVEFKGKADGNEELKAFQSEFIKGMNPKRLLALANSANYLEIKYLLDFLCSTISDQIKNKDVDYVRELFDLENDFNDEEYEKAKAEAPWAHENLDNDVQ